MVRAWWWSLATRCCCKPTRILAFGAQAGGSPQEGAWIPARNPCRPRSGKLREETGLDVVPADLRGPIASRVVTHGYSDRILIQNEIFYRVEVEPFIPDPAALTQGETERLTAQRWFPIDALPSPLWPAELGQLLSWAGGAPIELGHVEESTVPVIPQELPDDR